MMHQYDNYTDLYDIAPVGYFTIDNKGFIAEVNATGANLLGMMKEMLVSRVFTRYIAPESQAAFSEYFRLAFKKDIAQQSEIKFLKKDGTFFDARLDGKVIKELPHQKLLLMIT